MFGRFMLFVIMRGITSFGILFLILAAVQVIPYFRAGQVAERLLFTLMRVFVSCTFHHLQFWVSNNYMATKAMPR